MDINDLVLQLDMLITENILKRPNKKIDPDEKLISSGLIDSFNLVDLGILVEENFNVRIDDSELSADTFDTLRELASLIEARK